MEHKTSFVKCHPLFAFFVLTFALSWAPAVMLAVNPRFPLPIFAAGPSVAALIVAAIAEGRAGLRDLFSRSLRWRVGLRWYVVALFAPILFFVAAVYLNVLLGAPAPTLAQPSLALDDLRRLGEIDLRLNHPRSDYIFRKGIVRPKPGIN